MRRRDLIALLREGARDRGLDFELSRQGANHEVWSLDGFRIPIPRHREIPEGTARSILRQAEKKLGKDWWR